MLNSARGLSETSWQRSPSAVSCGPRPLTPQAQRPLRRSKRPFSASLAPLHPSLRTCTKPRPVQICVGPHLTLRSTTPTCIPEATDVVPATIAACDGTSHDAAKESPPSPQNTARRKRLRRALASDSEDEVRVQCGCNCADTHGHIAHIPVAVRGHAADEPAEPSRALRGAPRGVAGGAHSCSRSVSSNNPDRAACTRRAQPGQHRGRRERRALSVACRPAGGHGARR